MHAATEPNAKVYLWCLKIDIVGFNVLNRIHSGNTQSLEEVTLCLGFIYDFLRAKAYAGWL